MCQYCRDELFLGNAGAIVAMPTDNNNSISFKFKEKIRDQTNNLDTKDVTLKYIYRQRNEVKNISKVIFGDPLKYQ